MTREWCATIWLPRPITQRSPIRSTGTGPRSWPGTIPADRVTKAPMSVSSPTVIQRSPKTEPGGKAAIEPRPNAANRCPAGVSAVTAPARCTVSHPQCAARHRSWRSQAPVTAVPLSPGRDRSGQLTAGTVDLAAPGVPHRDRDAVCIQATDELALRGGPRRGPLRPGGGVERDQVDVREPPGQQRAQPVGPPGLVVDVPDQGVLDRDAAAGGRGVVPGGGQHLLNIPPLVYRDECVAQFVVRGMQGHGQP